MQLSGEVKMLRVALDTNVFISGIKTQYTPPGQILDSWMQKQIIIVTSPQLLSEIYEVLMRPAILNLLKKTPVDVKEFMKLLMQKTFVTKGKMKLNELIIDPDDNIVLSCAVEGQAAYLITGNKKHFPFESFRGVKIVNPREIINILNKI